MPKFIATPYKTIFPKPRTDPFTKQLVQDPPYRQYHPRSQEELFQLYKAGDPEIIEVDEKHADQVLRRQKGYQEIDIGAFDVRLVKNHRGGAKRTRVTTTKNPDVKT